MKRIDVKCFVTLPLMVCMLLTCSCGINKGMISSNVDEPALGIDGADTAVSGAPLDDKNKKILQEEKTDDTNFSEFSTRPLENNGYLLEPVHVTVPGCTKEYKILFLADLHIIISNDEVSDDETEYMKERIEDFTSNFQIQWDELSELLDECNPDMILLGGDMIDFCSRANTEELSAGIERMGAPYLYIRADHDIQPFWLKEQDSEKCKALQDMICDNEDVMFLETDDFIILGINNNTYQITQEGLATVREVFDRKKPIVLLAHVPYYSEVDDSLAKTARNRWPDRKRELIWGNGFAYEPDENTQQLMDLIYSQDSPVVQILSGHLHCMWDGKITEGISEHVFSPAYLGYIGIITVDGKP